MLSKFIGWLRNWRVQTVILVVLSVAAMFFVVFRDQILPERFSGDAAAVIEIAQGGEAVDRYYQFMADVFSTLGLIEVSWAVGMISVLVMVGLVFWIRRGEGRSGLLAFGLQCVAIALTPIFLGTFSKDVFELIMVTLVGILLINWKFNWVAIMLGILLFGTLVRPYFLVVGVIFLGWMILLKVLGKIKAWQMALVVAMTVVGACVGYWAMTGGGDISMTRVVASGAYEAQSAIVNVMEPTGLPSAIVNSLVVLVGLFIPFGMFWLGTVYHVAAGLLIMGIMCSFAFWVSRQKWDKASVGVRASTGLMLAFFAVSCLFEPDFGSYLRHLVPVMPFMIYCLVAAPPLDKKTIS